MTHLRIGPDVGVEATDGVVYVATLPAGPIVVLEGTAAEIWAEVCEGDRAFLASRIAARLGTETVGITDDLAVFIQALIEAGLLAEVD